MHKEKTETFEVTLRNLTSLQLIDSRIDEIHTLRGALPEEADRLAKEVENQEQELSDKKQQIETLTSDIKRMQEESQRYNIEIDQSITKLEDIQNNREYLAIESEVEYKRMEVELRQKKTRQAKAAISGCQEDVTRIEETLEVAQKHKNAVDSKLKKILSETEKDKKYLTKKKGKFITQIAPRDLDRYQTIRNRFDNNLAVVTLDRGAAIGSYIMVPPQVRIEIAQRQEMIFDEYSGRILVDNELMKEQTEGLDALLKSL